MSSTSRCINFGAGPGCLPINVLEDIQRNLLNWNNSGVSILEMGHRTTEFESIINTAQVNLRKLLSIPSNYKILFLQSGANGQFSAIPLNLIADNNREADYIVTGIWSKKAAEEASKYCKVNVIYSSEAEGFTTLPINDELKFSNNPAYIYYCANETVNGVEFQDIPNVPDNIPLIADFSSSFLSHAIDVKRFGLIYAGAQKNIGPAGSVVVIVRDDLINNISPLCPTVWNYKLMADNNSMYNTPPCFNIYSVGLVFQHIVNETLEKITRVNAEKAQLLYSTIDDSNGFYYSKVQKHCRSKMNVVFQIKGGKVNQDLFSKEAKELNMIQLAGHRSVGGMRASLYNAMSLENVEILVKFMNDFRMKYDI